MEPVMNHNYSGTTTEVMVFANNSFTEDATVIKIDSPIARSARVDAVSRKMFAFYHESSVLAADLSANGTTMPERTDATNSITVVVKATRIVSTTLKSVKIGVKEFVQSRRARPKLLTCHILVNRTVKMTVKESVKKTKENESNANANVNVNVIPQMEVFAI